MLVTFGTIFANPEILTPLIRHLAAKEYGVRVALGVTVSPADFAIDADTVVFEGFRPYAELLDGIDVVVGHGGAGTNLGALAEGVPLVLIPQGADQGGQAECVGRAGAAITAQMMAAMTSTTRDGLRSRILAMPSGCSSCRCC